MANRITPLDIAASFGVFPSPFLIKNYRKRSNETLTTTFRNGLEMLKHLCKTQIFAYRHHSSCDRLHACDRDHRRPRGQRPSSYKQRPLWPSTETTSWRSRPFLLKSICQTFFKYQHFIFSSAKLCQYVT